MRRLSAAAFLVLLACDAPESVRVDVASGSTSTAVTLLFSADTLTAIRGFRVARSRLEGGRGRGIQGHVYWAVLAADGSKKVPGSVTYGTAPAGFSATRAELLTPGPYEVEVLLGNGSAVSYFEVRIDGTVTSRGAT